LLSKEEGFEIVEDFVSKMYYSERFSYLRKITELEDLVHDTYLHFLEKKAFKKFDPDPASNTKSKKYYLYVLTRNFITDYLRTHQQKTVSLDKELNKNDAEKGLSLMKQLKAKVCLEANLFREDLLNKLTEEKIETKATGDSPILGECELNLKTIAIHLDAGYKPKEITEFFKYEDRNISLSRIYQHINNVKAVLKT